MNDNLWTNFFSYRCPWFCASIS